MKHETITELEALQNAVDYYNLTDLKIHEKHFEDKRKTTKMYFLHNHKTGETISPVLDYEQLNHFLLGYGRALKKATTPQANTDSQPEPSQKRYTIVENIADHEGYQPGEFVYIVKKLPDNYFIVSNAAGKEWQVGEEEIRESTTEPSQKDVLFTPGKWKVEKYTGEANKGFETPVIVEENERKVCCIGFIWGDTREQSIANAELIASAPKLKEQVKVLLQDNTKLIDEIDRLKAQKETAMLLALEFGYKQCEKGENLEAAFLNYNSLTKQ